MRDATSHQPILCFAMAEQCKDPGAAGKITDSEGLTHEFLWGLPVPTLPFLKTKQEPNSSYREQHGQPGLPLVCSTFPQAAASQTRVWDRQATGPGPADLGHHPRSSREDGWRSPTLSDSCYPPSPSYKKVSNTDMLGLSCKSSSSPSLQTRVATMR